jgi:hypothetical protein
MVSSHPEYPSCPAQSLLRIYPLSFPFPRFPNEIEIAYLWQVDIGNDNAVQGTWCILRRVLWVSTGVVLVSVNHRLASIYRIIPNYEGVVLEVISRLIALGALSLPWHTLMSHCNLRLGGRGCGLAAYTTHLSTWIHLNHNCNLNRKFVAWKSGER